MKFGQLLTLFTVSIVSEHNHNKMVLLVNNGLTN